MDWTDFCGRKEHFLRNHFYLLTTVRSVQSTNRHVWWCGILLLNKLLTIIIIDIILNKRTTSSHDHHTSFKAPFHTLPLSPLPISLSFTHSLIFISLTFHIIPTFIDGVEGGHEWENITMRQFWTEAQYGDWSSATRTDRHSVASNQLIGEFKSSERVKGSKGRKGWVTYASQKMLRGIS